MQMSIRFGLEGGEGRRGGSCSVRLRVDQGADSPTGSAY